MSSRLMFVTTVLFASSCCCGSADHEARTGSFHSGGALLLQQGEVTARQNAEQHRSALEAEALLSAEYPSSTFVSDPRRGWSACPAGNADGYFFSGVPPHRVGKDAELKTSQVHSGYELAHYCNEFYAAAVDKYTRGPSWVDLMWVSLV